MIIHEQNILICSSLTEDNTYYIIKPYREKDKKVVIENNKFSCIEGITKKEIKLINKYIKNEKC